MEALCVCIKRSIRTSVRALPFAFACVMGFSIVFAPVAASLFMCFTVFFVPTTRGLFLFLRIGVWQVQAKTLKAA